MLLTLTTTHQPATDLGFLLRKNPARLQTFDLPFGEARVFYPVAEEARCTCALQVVIDPIRLVRKGGGPSGDRGTLDQYVNDRPYAASSFLSVAIARVFDSALSGRAKERPDLVDVPLPLVATISALPCGGDGSLLRRLFEPLGYGVTVVRAPLDETFPEWGESRYHRVELTATVPLHVLLSHLYVLIPVLDGDKHYWVGDDEVEKLLRHGEGWLATHPERELIARRYLKHRRSLVDHALAQLADDALPEADVAACDENELVLEGDIVATPSASESVPTTPLPQSAAATTPSPSSTPSDQASEQANDQAAAPATLHDHRLDTVLDVLKTTGASSVLDLGCGEGRLLRRLLGERQFTRITGMDVSHRALEITADRLKLDRLPPKQRERLTLLHGSLMYRDTRLAGHEAAAVVEVIEHLDPPRLAAFERVLFECARPATVVLTTPNRDYNVLFPALSAGEFRHRDHRFEWTRAEFTAWCERIAARFGYTFRLAPIGPADATHGAPSQMAVFSSLT